MTNRAVLLLLALGGVLPAVAQTGPIDGKQAVVMVQHDGSEGWVRVNGVPILFFSSNPAMEEGPITDSVGSFSTFAKNGPNVVSIEARPEKGQAKATTTLSAIVATGSFSDLEKPPLFKETIEGNGKAEKTIVLKNVPQWAFLEVQPFTGNKDGVLNAVRALYKVFADHDAKALQAAFTPMYNDLVRYMGQEAMGNAEEFSQHVAQLAKEAQVEPLPADLKVESGYDDRLFFVRSAGGKPPIRVRSKELGKDGQPRLIMETGSYWIHRPEGWFMIRR
jgi:hypothetical protein